MKNNKVKGVSCKEPSNSMKWIYILLIAIALAGFFMPWFKLSIPEAGAAAAQQRSLGIAEVTGLSQNFTVKHKLGTYSGLNPFSGLTLLYAIPVFALICVIFLFAKLSLAGKAAKWFLAGILLVSPVYAQVMLKKAISNIMEAAAFELQFGALLCGAVGIALIVLLVMDRKGQDHSLDIFEEYEQKLRICYIALSMLSLVSLWLPYVRLFVPSGLKSTQIYNMTFAELIRISPDVKVMSMLSWFGPETGLGMSMIFYAIPIISIVLLASIYLKKHAVRRVSALVNSVLLIAASSGLMSVIKDNIPNVAEISRMGISIGAWVMFAAGVGCFCVFVMDKPNRAINSVAKSSANHRISYIALSVMACVAFLLPWSSLSASVANSLGPILTPVPEGMSLPIGVPTAIKLLGSPVYLLFYMILIPVLSILSIAATMMNAKKLKRIACAFNSAALIISPVLFYAKLGSMFDSVGAVKLRFPAILATAIGICLLVTILTDKDDELALKTVWKKVNKTFEVILTASFAVVQLYPLLWLLLASFKNNNEIFSGKVLALPTTWHFENYSRVLFGAQANETVSQAVQRAMSRQKDMTLLKFIFGGGSEGNILRYFMNSAFVVAVTVAVVVLFGAMASYAISRIKWKYGSLAFTFFILGMMIPVHVALSPLYVAFAGMGLIDSLWSLIIPYIGFGLPISIIVISGFMESIPYEIEESAKIDGANILTVFFKIIIPMVMPAISTVLIFVFLQSWNELMFATSFITSGVKRTITVGINSIAISQYNTEYALIFAGLVIASLPTIIIYLAGSQQVQKSLIVGAVKG